MQIPDHGAFGSSFAGNPDRPGPGAGTAFHGETQAALRSGKNFPVPGVQMPSAASILTARRASSSSVDRAPSSFTSSEPATCVRSTRLASISA